MLKLSLNHTALQISKLVLVINYQSRHPHGGFFTSYCFGKNKKL